MSSKASAPTALSSTSSTQEALARVEPQLRDLMALARPAQALPSWSKRMRTRQAGQYLSQVRGRGMEYDESRLYQGGDDIRHLDWRVTARTGKPHTKLFREERERPVFTALDFNATMFFGTRKVFKAVQAARIAALLAWRANLNGDRVGGLLFAGDVHHELAPRRGQTAVARWLKLITAEAPRCRERHQDRHAQQLFVESLVRLRRVAKPGSLVFVLSDFSLLNEQGRSELTRLAAHTDTALVLISDPLDQVFPKLRGSGAIGDHTETLQLGSVSATQRQKYHDDFLTRENDIRDLCREQRMLFTHVSTEDDATLALMRWFRS